MSTMFLRIQLIIALALLGGSAVLLFVSGSPLPAVLCTAGALVSVGLLVHVIRASR